MKRRSLTVDGFFSEAHTLRRHFEGQFSDPRQAHGERFVWDWWHIPDQYTLLRTPAYHYFPSALYQKWHARIVNWGREVLGCHDISPPWLSCYVEGCGQELHADNPHGPWAFVYSLTPWRQRKFTGGETILLRPEVLNYWQGAHFSKGFELNDLTERLPAPFDRLTVFDPRIPHGVREVRGVKDPREGRLVIHGWFVQPRPFVKGALTPQKIRRDLDSQLGALIEGLPHAEDINGYLSLRLDIAANGKVRRVNWLADTLQGEPNRVGGLCRVLRRETQKWQFAKAKGVSQLTLPLLFGDL